MPNRANGPAKDSTVDARDVTARMELASSTLPTRTSIFPATCGCFRSISARTSSSFRRSRPAMAQRTDSPPSAALGDDAPPGVYFRARYSAASLPVNPEPPHITRSYGRVAMVARGGSDARDDGTFRRGRRVFRDVRVSMFHRSVDRRRGRTLTPRRG
eukprot:31206-Pelagococcus_subviridis.AAC.6